MFLKQRNLQRFGGKDFLLILLGFYINLFLANVTISYAMNIFPHKVKGFLVFSGGKTWEHLPGIG